MMFRLFRLRTPCWPKGGLNRQAEEETVDGPIAGPDIDRHPFGLGGGGFEDLDDFDDPRPEVVTQVVFDLPERHISEGQW
jgi:hypothetical protein